MKNLFTLIFSILSVGLIAQTTYWSESLDNGLPESWSVEGDWSFGAAGDLGSAYFTIPDNGTGNMAVFNDDGLGGTHVGSGAISTDAIDLTAVSGTVVLEFASYFPNLDYGGANERAIINISSNGKTYDFLAEVGGGETAEFGAFFLDISEYAGSTIYLQFVYEDGAAWNYGWAFDEVAILDRVTVADARDYLLSVGTSTILNDAQDGIDYTHEGFIINNGFENITSFDVTATDGTTTLTTSVTDVDVPIDGIQRYSMDEAFIVEGNKTITVSISNVNGDMTPDAVEDDNSGSFQLNAYTALNPDRGVLAEEATGTWCTWCPRGTANMDELAKRFPDNFVGVAVHNSDPMVLDGYGNSADPNDPTSEAGALIQFEGFQGFPSVVLERTSIIDPGNLPAITIPMMNEAPPAGLTVGAAMSATGVTTSIQVDFLTEVTDAHNVAIIITEDGVTGSEEDRYFQINAYAGGGQGPMGGYEFLPGSVPASFNVFDHVGRALVGGWEGNAEALDGALYTAGMTDGWVFDEVSLPADVNMDNLYIIGVLINSATGEIVNATQASILDAAANGVYNNVSTKDVFDATLAEVYPNPVNNFANIKLNLENAADVNVTIINSLGQTVAERNYGSQAGSVLLQQDMSSLSEGMYMINITAGDRFITKKINKVN